jgi:hypothetical protein
MSVPKPPFHSAAEELLYNIYLKLSDNMGSLTTNDINTLAKLNAILTDADLMKAEDIVDAINAFKGNVPVAGDTLEKLYNIIQALNYLKAEDIDTLAEINAIIIDADLIKTDDLASAINGLKGNIPAAVDTLEKLYNSIWLPDGNNFGSIKFIGSKDNFSLPFITNNIERARISATGQFLIGVPDPVVGLETYKLQIAGYNALGISGNSMFQEGSVNIILGKVGTSMANAFRINSYVPGFGGFDFLLSASNPNASIEISDSLFGGTRNEMIRLSPGGYANTGILIRPNDVYNTAYGYRYLLQGTNVGQQSRYVSAFNAQIIFPVDDTYSTMNRATMFSAQATVTNHFIDGFYADVRGTDPNSQAFAYHSTGSRIFFDGNGMTFNTPVVSISTDGSPQPGATNYLLNGSYVISAALFIVPMGAERTGLIISPGQTQANGLFLSPQQTLGTYNYDGYLMWLQYSTTGNNILGGTSKPMLYIRKHNAQLNGFDHTGAFIRMEENIGSTGSFIEALKYDTASNSLKVKFSVDRDGVLSVGKIDYDPDTIDSACRLYFRDDELRYLTSAGEIRVVNTFWGP